MRAARNAVDGDPFPHLKHYFETVAMAQLARSAEQAKERAYLTPADIISCIVLNCCMLPRRRRLL
jgi:3-hydroxyacyl-CoA dehydrogenase